MAWLSRRLGAGHAPTFVLAGTAGWCALELLRSATPLHWSYLGLTQSPHNLAVLQLAQLAGPTAVTAVLVATNGLLAEAILARWGARSPSPIPLAAAALAVLLGAHGLGWVMLARPLASAQAEPLQVGIVQGNVPNEIKLKGRGRRQAIARYTRGYRQLAAAGADAVLTPETALPLAWPQYARRREQFYRAVVAAEVPAWLGAFGAEGQTNSLFALTGEGQTRDRYDKAHLVPLGEYVPLEGILGGAVDRLSPLESRLAAGELGQTFETAWGPAIAGICYESAFAHHFRQQAARGGRFILSASNDAHYSRAMPAQHHAQDVMRAIETDRWAVRATNTGYSAIVDPRGRTQWISGFETYATHLGTITPRQTQTPYVRWGDWLTWGLVGAAAASWGWAEWRR